MTNFASALSEVPLRLVGLNCTTVFWREFICFINGGEPVRKRPSPYDVYRSQKPKPNLGECPREFDGDARPLSARCSLMVCHLVIHRRANADQRGPWCTFSRVRRTSKQAQQAAQLQSILCAPHGGTVQQNAVFSNSDTDFHHSSGPPHAHRVPKRRPGVALVAVLARMMPFSTSSLLLLLKCCLAGPRRRGPRGPPRDPAAVPNRRAQPRSRAPTGPGTCRGSASYRRSSATTSAYHFHGHRHYSYHQR